MKVFLCAIIACISMATASVDHVSYLKKYNYLSANTESFDAVEYGAAMSNAIEQFQSMFNLQITGEMNEETINAMELPRCGVADVDSSSLGFVIKSNSENYVAKGSKWHHTEITYRVVKYTKDLTRAFVDETVVKALSMWTDVTPLTFRRVTSGGADIEISFVVRAHGDNSPFDGPGHTLAHAYFPSDDNKPIRGDAHFDDDELWLEKGRGSVRHSYNLLQTMTHEFGHSLGLRHSKVAHAVMAPHYQPYDANFKLTKDDIDGIQSIYGKPSHTETTEERTTTTDMYTTTTAETSGFDRCTDGQLDAVTSSGDGKVYGFRGSHFFKFHESVNGEVLTQNIAEGWRGLPNDLDAALFWKQTSNRRARVYFFKGSKYYRFEGRRLMAGYPKDISCGFPGVPTNVDSAFVYHKTGETFFVKGNYFYKYSRGQNGSRAVKVHRSNTVFRHLRASPVDAVFYWAKYSNEYYFSGKQYYKLNSDMTSNNRYPRNIAKLFLGCK